MPDPVAFAGRSRGARLTVVTGLNKLVAKGLLRRAKREGVFHYGACWTEEEFRSHVARRVVEGMLAFEPHALVISFVDVLAERDRAQLADVGRLVEERLTREER